MSQRRIILLFAVLMLASLALARAQSGRAAGPLPESRIKPPTAITTCGTVITTPGTYTISNGLFCNGGDGVDISASDVTLEFMNESRLSCNGCSTSQTGIRVYDPAGGAISGVNILGTGVTYEFPTGLSLAGVKNSQITGMVTIFATTGLLLDSSANGDPSEHLFVTGNSFSGTGSGIQANSVYNSILIGNTCLGGETSAGLFGIQLLNGNDNLLTGNTCYDATTGIQLGGTGSTGVTHNTLTGNTVNGTSTGILVTTGANGNRFTANYLWSNSVLDIDEGNASCGTDVWLRDVFTKSNQSCVH